MKQLSFIILFLSITVLLFSQKRNEVRIHQLGDVQHLNFTTATDYQSTVLSYQTHQYLYHLDPVSYEYLPVLVKERAKQYVKDDLLHYDFEIRPEAEWDNGEEITGEDIVFSLKLIFAPDIEKVGRLKPYLDYIKDIKIDEENPKKFTVVCKEPYMSAETSIATNLLIIPQYIYDPENILNNYSLNKLFNDNNESDEKLIKYAEFFNSDLFKFEITNGSGPYEFVKWDTNERLVLKRKSNWWGDQVKGNRNVWFDAFPEIIEYVTITDLTTAVTTMIEEQIDVMASVPNKQFLEIKKEFPDRFHYETPPLFAYDYIGMNTKHPILSDVKVREALTYLMDVDQLIEEELHGLGKRMVTFTHSDFGKILNPELKLYDFNIEKAKSILENNGWEDLDGDGILDKEINGERETFSITIFYNNGNDRRKKAATILIDNAEKIGVQINIRVLEWLRFLERVRGKDYDLYLLGWAVSPMESDPAQIWHTDAYNDGANYVGFGNEESNKIIDELRNTPEYEKRIPLYHQLQEMVHNEKVYIFLVSQKNRIMINKKFRTNASGMQGGFIAQHFRLE